jgi:inorganic triphosphatase YgiF
MEGVEVELKLAVEPRRISALKRAIASAAIAQREMEVDNVYFDTDDRLLHRHRMALRLRSVDGRWLQTLKIAPEIARALTQRGEWETPAPVENGVPGIDLARLSTSPLPALLEQHGAGSALRPVFRTRFRRSLWKVEAPQASIEVALDVGGIDARRATKTLTQPICELELELKRGDPLTLYDYALHWSGGVGGPMFRPAVLSKAERGYRLTSRSRAKPVKAGARGFVAVLRPEMTNAETLRAVIAHGVAVVLGNAGALDAGDDPEFVHQARVALRRMRSAVRLLDDGRDFPSELAADLRWLARALGAARDWDVMTRQTLPALIAGMRGPVKTTLAHAEQRRVTAHEHAQRAVRSGRYVRMVLGLERWSLTQPPSTGRLSDSAGPRLRRASRRLLKASRSFAGLDAAHRHRVRILAKRLRYALDLYAVVLPQRATASYVEALAELQDALGALNDAAVAMTLLPKLTESSALVAAAVRRSQRSDAETVAYVEKRLSALRRLEAPWRRKIRKAAASA